VHAALRVFEEARRPGVEKFLAVAQRSYAWYERFREKMRLEPLPFAYDYLMRSGRISHARLKEVSPQFAVTYEASYGSESMIAPQAGKE